MTFQEAYAMYKESFAENPIELKHSGTLGATITINTPVQLLEWDANANGDWCDFLDGLGLEAECSLDDAIKSDELNDWTPFDG